MTFFKVHIISRQTIIIFFHSTLKVPPINKVSAMMAGVIEYTSAEG